jgi:hypothetical protein
VITNLKKIKMKKNLIKSVKMGLATLILGGLIFAIVPVTFAGKVIGDPPGGGSIITMPRPIPPPPKAIGDPPGGGSIITMPRPIPPPPSK